jgi:hypothetical protein
MQDWDLFSALKDPENAREKLEEKIQILFSTEQRAHHLYMS